MGDSRFDFLEIDNKPACPPRPIQGAGEDEVSLGERSGLPFCNKIGGDAGAEPAESDPKRSGNLTPDQIIGSYGQAPGEFNSPGGISVDVYGCIYVADSYNHRVQKIMPDGRVFTLGSKGTGAGFFLNPQDVFIDFDYSFYVVEQGNCRIQRFGTDGRLMQVIGRCGDKPGEFNSPMGIAPDGRGGLWVADSGNRRLQRLDYKGQPIFCIWDSENSRLRAPQGVKVDLQGRCYAVDTFQHCIIVFDDRGVELSRFGKQGTGPGEFNEPQDLAIDDDGLLYIVEMGNNRLQVCDENGASIGCFTGDGTEAGRLKSPTGVTVGMGGEIYVSDTRNHRIIKLCWQRGG